MAVERPSKQGVAFYPWFGIFAPFIEYMVDAGQRSVLFVDVLRERGIPAFAIALSWRTGLRTRLAGRR
jgi:hypothetical protein